MNIGTIPVQVDSSILLGHWTASSASTKIIKKKFYEEYKFLGTKANDVPCIYPILASADKIIYYPNLYKYYRVVQKSLSRKDDEESYNSVVDSIIKAFKLLDELNAQKEKEILFFNNCMEYFIYVLGEIKNDELKARCIINFYNKLKKYEDNIFEEMKKSVYFKKFMMKNHIIEEEYNKFIKEKPCEFIYYRNLLEENKIIKREKDLIDINLKEYKELNTQLKDKIHRLNNIIKSYEESKSWKITKPIRQINCRIKKIMK